MLYADLIKTIAAHFDSALNEMKAVHNFDFGDEFEIAVCKVLRRVLPQRYGICRGFVVSESGKSAGDDIIVFERTYYPTLRSLADGEYAQKEQIPVEAVFAYVEAKHTLTIAGDGASSFNQALHQAAAVKELVNAREPRPTTAIGRRIMVSGPYIHLDHPKGWPDRQNPVYTAVMARRVRLKEGEEIETDAKKIYDTIISTTYDLSINQAPDMVVAGDSVVGVAVQDGGKVIRGPFCIEPMVLSFHPAANIAFGVGIVHMLWAIDSIELAPMKWDRMLIEALNIPTK